MKKISLPLSEQSTLPALRPLFHKYMKIFVQIFAFFAPIAVGYWRYETQSDSPGIRDFFTGFILGAPFSLGYWLSTLVIGKKVKWIVLLLILPSIAIHIAFFEYLWPLVLTIGTYSIYLLFRKTQDTQ